MIEVIVHLNQYRMAITLKLKNETTIGNGKENESGCKE
jgi:hypothetical protein